MAKQEGKVVMDRGSIRKCVDITLAAVNTGTYMEQVAKIAQHAIPKDATRADLKATAKAIASAAGRSDDAMFASRTLIVLEARESVPAIVSGLKAHNTCSREHVLSALRWIRKRKVSAAVAVKKVIAGETLNGERGKASPVKSAIHAVQKLVKSLRGERRESAERALAILAKLEA